MTLTSTPTRRRKSQDSTNTTAFRRRHDHERNRFLLRSGLDGHADRAIHDKRFLAGLCIALAAGVMGYFTIARHSTFAAHALAHIGLPGATGAVLLGLPVSAGLGVFALGGAW